MTRQHLLVHAALGAALSLAAAPPPAQACGGLFCDVARPTPIQQQGEQIIFSVDHDRREVQAIINIQYQGAAPSFAWILPLRVAPSAIEAVPSTVFAAADAVSAARFEATVERRGLCSGGLDPGLPSAARSTGGSFQPTVLRRDLVGPYESVVLEAHTAEDAERWLRENRYLVTRPMLERVVPYLAQGDVLLALKLREGREVGDISPIALTLGTTELCVPIRLTAIGAQPDMGISVLILSNRGRAIPRNYHHLELNLARIDWLARGLGYRELLAQAADEAGGNAFFTEFSGSARRFDGQISRPDRYDRRALVAQPSAERFRAELTRQGLDAPETAAIVARYAEQGLFDSAAAAGEVFAVVVEGERKVQALFDRFQHATRLYTLLSPDEMEVDPIFDFRDDLPDVDNVRRAQVELDCGFGGSGQNVDLTIRLEDGREIFWADQGGPGVHPRLAQLPAAERVEQLHERRVVQDNRAEIDGALAELARARGCRCAGAEAQPSPLLPALLLLFFARGGRR